jgi:hypothetical protein
MRLRAATAGLTAAIIAAVSLSGCGSSTLSAKALRTRANLLCTTAVRRSYRIATPHANSGGAAFLAQGITIFGSELDALHKLAPPRNLASAYRTSLSDSAQQLDALIATHHDLVAGDDPVVAIKQLDVELAAVNARDRAAWRAVGVPACTNL